jgi:hypothetical protein
VRLAVLLLLLAGCDQIFKLTPPDEPEPTVPPRTVSVVYDRIVVENTGPTQPTNVDPETFAVTRLDGTEIPFTRTGLGTYEFTTDAATYTIDAATALGGTQVQLGGATVHLRERVLGRTMRTAPQAGTILQFDALPIADPGGKPEFNVLTTGMWAQAGIAQPTDALDYSELASFGGPLGVIESQGGDALFLLEYGSVEANLPSRRQLLGYRRDTPIVVQGGTTQILGNLMATASRHCMRVTADRAEELARLESVVPSSFAFPNADWIASAIPHEALHASGSVMLARDAAPSFIDAYDVKFENPISATTILSMGARLQRNFKLPGTELGSDLVYELRTYNAPVALQSGAACTPQQLPAGRTALVGSISVDGKAITRDDLEVSTTTTKPLDITWSTADGDVDAYTTSLIEMVAIPTPGGTGMRTVQVARISVTTTGTRASIPRSYLERGRYYFITVETNTGFPGAADGDFSTIAYPRGIGRAVSGVFKAE